MSEKRLHRRSFLPGLYALAGSFIIAVSWGWYHFNKHPKWVFFEKELATWLLVTLGFVAAKLLFAFLVVRFRRHIFWQEIFLKEFEGLYFLGSFFFIIFFIQIEWLSLVYVALLLLLVFWRLQKIISFHPSSQPWLEANRAIFSLSYFLFLVQAALQFSAYHYYILDSNIKFFNIVMFRSFVMTLFWLLGFAIANFFIAEFRGFVRYIILFLWVALFAGGMVLWTVNLGILYYSGLYFSPVVLEHIAGAAGVVANPMTLYLILSATVVFVGFILILIFSLRAHQTVSKRYWRFYNAVITLIALGALFGLTSFRNTPEHDMAVAFYDYYFGKSVEISLDPIIAKKLAKFGLHYEPAEFYVNSRPNVFSPTTTPLLPARLLKNKPNIVMVFVESFSARLSDVYSTKYAGVTPNFLAFSNDRHTTIFKHFYNASTPTITGTLSQLCSFLPPTGHNEIENERKMQNHHLLCLPEVLKTQAGFEYAAYVTAVEKEFAHKDGIFTSAGVDKIFGTEELKQYITGAPLSWGYSDHQLFPVLWNFMQTAPQPWLMMLATVDSHPPFDLAKDAVNYGDGSRPVLNSFHTTDDAFGKFWTEFQQSPFYQNTIVVVVADHAIFPGALTTDLFPEDAKTLSYYDQNFLAMYIPDNILPKIVDVYSSGIDMAPTLLQLFNVNIPNSFEGRSIFDDRSKYPNVLGMHELGLYINQVTAAGKRTVDYNVPTDISCPANYTPSSTPDLTECDFLQFYNWKRQMFEQGRFWKH
jgi:phosphoglycerol transferase MdoB-like AlkP superfamily enzyme